jgi:glycosyltransferase involved in cell wall biosynthesis
MATLSIVIANYNDGGLIGSALGRLVVQTRPANGIIVIDDGSTDDSLDRIRTIADANSNMRMPTHPTNKGLRFA